MNLPEWAKTTLFFVGLSVIWDIIRTTIQIIWTGHFTRKLMQKDFKKIEEAVEDVEDAIEEENNVQM